MTDWNASAACRGKPHDLFFGAPGIGTRVARFDPAPALDVCARCPVVAECKADAIANGDISADGTATYGVIAGVAPPTKGWRPPPSLRVCALPGCNVRFQASARGQKFYCCAEHSAEGGRLAVRSAASGRKEPSHGTAAGYKQHCRLGTPACDECKAAKAREVQAYKRRTA